jgi:hypothetical protein
VRAPSENIVFPDFVVYGVMALGLALIAAMRLALGSPQDDLTREYERREAQRAAEDKDATRRKDEETP